MNETSIARDGTPHKFKLDNTKTFLYNASRFGYVFENVYMYHISPFDADMSYPYETGFDFFACPVVRTQENQLDFEALGCYEYLREQFKDFPYKIEIGSSENCHCVGCTLEQYENAVSQVLDKLHGFEEMPKEYQGDYD